MQVVTLHLEKKKHGPETTKMRKMLTPSLQYKIKAEIQNNQGSYKSEVYIPIAGEVGSSAPVPGVIGCPPGVPGK
jgi:hypothetical protein